MRRNYFVTIGHFACITAPSCAALSPGDRVILSACPGGFGRMADENDRPPLARRVPGATQAGPADPERRKPPELPEEFLQRIQAVVSAAHAQAARELEAQQEHESQPGRNKSSTRMANRASTRADGSKSPNGLLQSVVPNLRHKREGRLSDQDAEFDTAPIPRLTASGAIANPGVPATDARPTDSAEPNGESGTDQINRRAPTATRKRGAQHKQSSRQTGTQDQLPAAQLGARQEEENGTQSERERATAEERARQEQERAAQLERGGQQQERHAKREQKRTARQERATERARAAEDKRTARQELARALQERAREEQERAAQLEQERALQENERAEKERIRLEQELEDRQWAAQRRARQEREREEAEARARLQQHREDAEAHGREEQERGTQLEQDHARLEQERKEAERVRQERERKEAEERAHLEQQRKETEERARQEREREQAEARAREEQERATQLEQDRARQEQERERAQKREHAAADGAEHPESLHPAAGPTAGPKQIVGPESAAKPTASPRPAEKPGERKAAAAVLTAPDQVAQPEPGERTGLRRYRVPAAIAAAVALLAAGSLIIAQSLHTSARRSPTPAQISKATRDQAAAWVAQQVSSTAIMSCDPAMCRALKAHGVPALDLRTLAPDTSAFPGSQIVVATAAIRKQFGSSLASVYAPAVLASFGSGSARIDVCLIAPHGVAAFMSQLKADQQAREKAGATLLTHGPIALSPLARSQLAAGHVDSRLIVLLDFLAPSFRLNVMTFGDSGPRATPGMPLRSLTLTGSKANLRSVLTFVRTHETAPYIPEYTQITQRAGRHELLIEFSAPSPLGVFNPPSS